MKKNLVSKFHFPPLFYPWFCLIFIIRIFVCSIEYARKMAIFKKCKIIFLHAECFWKMTNLWYLTLKNASSRGAAQEEVGSSDATSSSSIKKTLLFPVNRGRMLFGWSQEKLETRSLKSFCCCWGFVTKKPYSTKWSFALSWGNAIFCTLRTSLGIRVLCFPAAGNGYFTRK